MIHYPESVIRNARHLIQIGQAVLDGKPIEHRRPGPGGTPIWELQNCAGSFLSTVYKSYRIARTEQLELQPAKENGMTPQRAKELAPIIAAYGEGKTIQYRQDSRFQWADYPNDNPHSSPSFTASGEYRIKPEPKWRMWKPEEVPLGGILLIPNQPGTRIIVAWSSLPNTVFCQYANQASLPPTSATPIPGLTEWYWHNNPNQRFKVGVLETPES